MTKEKATFSYQIMRLVDEKEGCSPVVMLDAVLQLIEVEVPTNIQHKMLVRLSKAIVITGPSEN